MTCVYFVKFLSISLLIIYPLLLLLNDMSLIFDSEIGRNLVRIFEERK